MKAGRLRPAWVAVGVVVIAGVATAGVLAAKAEGLGTGFFGSCPTEHTCQFADTLHVRGGEKVFHFALGDTLTVGYLVPTTLDAMSDVTAVGVRFTPDPNDLPSDSNNAALTKGDSTDPHWSTCYLYVERDTTGGKWWSDKLSSSQLGKVKSGKSMVITVDVTCDGM
jgi:hypothetical protein